MKEDEESTKGCHISPFHKSLQNTFYNLGMRIGLNPSYFILIPLFITIIAATGLQKMKFNKDPDYLFTPSNGMGKADRERVETVFPINFTDHFDPSRNTRITNFAVIFITAKDNETMLRVEHWNELNAVNDIVHNLTFMYNDHELSYKDICTINKGKCNKNQILNLNSIIEEFENGSRIINYPIMISPRVLPFYYGGPEVDDEEGHLISAKSIALTFFTRQQGKIDKEKSNIWELKLIKTILSAKFKLVRVTLSTSRSLEDEVDRNTAVVMPYILGNIMIMITFSVLSVMAIDWVRSKFYLGIIGVMSSLFATATGFGLLMYLGVDFIGVNLAIPFLLLGIGLDDQFVLLAAWHRTDERKTVPERMADAYTEAAASITITSITTMLSSFVGTTSHFPAVYYFTLYTGVCVFFLYLWFIFLYGGCLAIAGYAEIQGRHSIICVKVQSKSELGVRKLSLKRRMSIGGMNKRDPLNQKDKVDQVFPAFFRDYVAAFINNKISKVFILSVFVLYIMGAIYGLFQIKEGLEKQKMVLDESYLGDFFNDEDTMFRKYPYRIQIVIDEEIEYSNPETKEKLLKIHDMFEQSSFTAERIFSTSWIRHFYRWIERKPKLKAKIHDEISLIKVLKNDYLPRRKNYQLDVTFNKNETAIIASRWIIQTKWVNNTQQDKDMMLEMRDIASKAPFKTLTFHQFFVFFDQFLLIRMTTIQTVVLATVVMLIVAFIFIPSKLSCCAVAFSIVSIELGVIGYMSLWDVGLDLLSMMNLIMCIGFSVDFSAHISYAFLTADANSPDERVRICLHSLGVPVIQGGISTIMAVILLSLVSSYIYRIFFKIIFLVILLGIMHAIFLLPVILSFLGPMDISNNRRYIMPYTQSDMGVSISAITGISSRLTGIFIGGKLHEDSSSLDKDLGFCPSPSSSEESPRDKDAEKALESDTDNVSTESNQHTPKLGTHNKAYEDTEEMSVRL